jgi:PPOX class probable F420-dependent enzyme
VVFNTGADTGKGRALAREGRASMVVDDQTPPYSFVKVDGPVTLHDDLDEVRRFATIIGGRYMGDDRADEFGRRNGVPGELLVRLHPTTVTAAFDIAD